MSMQIWDMFYDIISISIYRSTIFAISMLYALEVTLVSTTCIFARPAMKKDVQTTGNEDTGDDEGDFMPPAKKPRPSLPNILKK